MTMGRDGDKYVFPVLVSAFQNPSPFSSSVGMVFGTPSPSLGVLGILVSYPYPPYNFKKYKKTKN